VVLRVPAHRSTEGGTEIWLNLGCGHNRRESAIGIDLTRDRGVDILGDASRLDFIRSDSVEGIVAHHFVEHIVDQEELFRTFHRVLKRGGQVWIRVPYKSAGLYSPFHHHVYDHKSFFEFCVDDPLSIQIARRFRMVRLRVNRKLIPERRFDLRWHLLRYLPGLTKKFLSIVAVTTDQDGRERSKIGIRDEIECWMEKV
jgi:SAM-dependent methyltransferase